MAGRFAAPVLPTLPELNAQALAGDVDAARMLAERSTTCAKVEDFIELYVPADEVGRALYVDEWGGQVLVFDVFCDAFQRSRAKALLDTVELPVVKSNLTGWPQP